MMDLKQNSAVDSLSPAPSKRSCQQSRLHERQENGTVTGLNVSAAFSLIAHVGYYIARQVMSRFAATCTGASFSRRNTTSHLPPHETRGYQFPPQSPLRSLMGSILWPEDLMRSCSLCFLHRNDYKRVAFAPRYAACWQIDIPRRLGALSETVAKSFSAATRKTRGAYIHTGQH
ncbi:uncharacterized protein CC84DRAFT_860291 [Paraphaeosphaeria sporulosa]|uniref:Uncharacterized protein n=1 Tax=Paraphaeosphaeria sporulosa TaxID=1460663 RepID=A0A177C8Z0_9PLEO|nr:uncharacterized protein CC84DRAFT_860291 [Paraphaeosphaeria sporulosa]OAG03591.1 hypothetical protein CC84DRAFT_860291 [Paraphaeosphaeria sporulosa]